jgi:hypothetical protein
LAQTAPRPRFPLPLSPAQAAQLHAPRAPLTAWPHPSATRLPPSHAAPSPSQLGPTCQLRRSRPCLIGASAAEPLLPRRLAIKARPTSAATSPLYPTRRLTPRLPEPYQSTLAPFPPSWRACRCSPSPPSLSLSRAPIKGPARAPFPPHQLRPSPPLSPEPIELAPPHSPVAPVSPALPSQVSFGQIKLVLELRHTITVTRHTSPPLLHPTAAPATSPPWTPATVPRTGRHRPLPVKLTPPP